MTSRKGRSNVIRLDGQAADGTKGFDTHNLFGVDPAPGYTVHVGARIASLNLSKHIRSNLKFYMHLLLFFKVYKVICLHLLFFYYYSMDLIYLYSLTFISPSGRGNFYCQKSRFIPSRASLATWPV